MKATDVKYKDVLKWATDELQKRDIRVPEFPEDPQNITSLLELQQHMYRFRAVYGWATRLLGLTEAELKLVEREINLYVDAKKPTVKSTGAGRITKEVAAAIILTEDEHIGTLYERQQQLIALQTMLEAIARTCDKHWESLSRDQARRESELKHAAK